MRKITCVVVSITLLPFFLRAQEMRNWTASDRQYLLENLIRSRDELQQEIKGLTKKQWSFKESPDRWSINEVVEHIATYELVFDYDIKNSLAGKPKASYNPEVKPDSYFLDFIMEEKPHVTTDYTKPFTFSVPMGTNSLENNTAWFLKLRNESIEFIKSTQENLRLYYRGAGNTNLHQLYIYVFGHADRHLRQIRNIKQHPNFPK